MTKNDYIEKITQNLEHLTKDELKDVSILTTAQLGVRSKFAERQQLEHEIANLTPQLQQQALPVVPECVAEGIESIPRHYSAYGAISLIKDKIKTFPEGNEDWVPIYKWLFDDINNQDVFALAFITGKYQVEKPQLFYIELPNVYGLKNKVSVLKVENGTIVEFSNGKNYALKLTEQEIKSIDERYWQFAVPVEDGE
ncbi:DUF1642 domain-containing protein [Lactococcus cremoris]|uniref:DUF1642 domain-containing protein n=1 Tax=Lactococcus lactis subsp. cremoris TaxID=1359 RepID=A0AAX4A5E5_LACLC|nr:DUF1642 domain-containing protein [Lactococcus cremoris]WMX69962.1 DUF1642 domain-containing protein [Lactococcus cremoris]